MLKAGIMENGLVQAAEVGTPQGSILSSLLSNVCFHYVLSTWTQYFACHGTLSGTLDWSVSLLRPEALGALQTATRVRLSGAIRAPPYRACNPNLLRNAALSPRQTCP